jgi:putative transposase
MPARQVFSAIVFVLRTGIQWKASPQQFGSASPVHQHFKNWHRAGFFHKLWQSGLAEYDGMHDIAWQWQAADGTMGEAPLATEYAGRNSTDRGEKGRKRSLLVDGHGLPLSIVVSGANVHDSKMLDRTLARVVVQRPEVTTWNNQQYLCLDAGYVGYPVSKITRKHGYHLRVKSRAEERLLKYRYPDSKPRRWVVERTHSWLNRYRKLLVSFEKTDASVLRRKY